MRAGPSDITDWGAAWVALLADAVGRFGAGGTRSVLLAADLGERGLRFGAGGATVTTAPTAPPTIDVTNLYEAAVTVESPGGPAVWCLGSGCT